MNSALRVATHAVFRRFGLSAQKINLFRYLRGSIFPMLVHPVGNFAASLRLKLNSCALLHAEALLVDKI